MHKTYQELSLALSQACLALVGQYGAPDSVRSPYSQVQITGREFRITGPHLELTSTDGKEWRATVPAQPRESEATIEDLQEGERIIAELAMLAANNAWLKKADGSIRRLKAIVKALEPS